MVAGMTADAATGVRKGEVNDITRGTVDTTVDETSGVVDEATAGKAVEHGNGEVNEVTTGTVLDEDDGNVGITAYAANVGLYWPVLP